MNTRIYDLTSTMNTRDKTSIRLCVDVLFNIVDDIKRDREQSILYDDYVSLVEDKLNYLLGKDEQ